MNFIAAAFHDGVLLYAQAVNETLERGGSITNASAITRQMWNRTFYGEPRPHPPPAPSPVGAACHTPGMIFWDQSPHPWAGVPGFVRPSPSSSIPRRHRLPED